MPRLLSVFTAILAAPLVVNASEEGLGSATPARLRCEYAVNPLGIEAAQPRLSWVLTSPRRGEMQTAWQVLVASSLDELNAGRGDLWDSGKTKADDAAYVVYAGQPLLSGQRAHWKVRVWDRDDRPSAWSEPAWWEMGVLSRDDWQGSWIAAADFRQPEAAKELEWVRWIWAREGDPRVVASEGTRYFRLHFDLPGDSPIVSGKCVIAADDTYTLYLNGELLGSAEWPVAGTYDVKRILRPGGNAVAVAVENKGGTAGLICKIPIEFANGEKKLILSDHTWKASDKPEPSDWNRLADDRTWQFARELCNFPCLPWGRLDQPSRVLPAPHFRKAFALDRAVKSARAYVSGLGYHELYLNGRKVGDHVLDPGFTRYDRRALYVVHDVTELLRKGENAAGIVLGNGWYNHHARAVWSFDKAPWRSAPCVLAQIRIEYEDGTQDVVATDASWQVGTGPILFDGLFVGERYDARLERAGWAEPGSPAGEWTPATVVEGPKGKLAAQVMPPMKVIETIKPVKVTEPKPGVHVFDMGQAFAGWAQLTVSGPAGTTVRLKYGERLNEDGTLRQNEIGEHFRDGEFQTDTYILKGEGEERWEPRFNYHGFRYVEVTGLPGKPTLDTLRGRVVHTAFEKAGSFACSNEMLNRIHACTLWSYRGNYHGYPTDCPHREKNGWTGDAHLAAEQAMYAFDNVLGYEKWMDDLFDEQQDTGALPGIVPTSGWGYHWGNGPAWDSAYVLIPWYLYQYQGDLRVLERHYDRMKRYVDYLTSRAKDGIVDFGLGDWVPAKTETPVAVTSTGYYYADTRIVASAAALLGKREDAARYGELAEKIRVAFNRRFYDAATGQYAGGTQTALSCALYQGLAEPQETGRVLQNLVANVAERDGHLDTGILGAKYLLHALSDGGLPEVAYTVATRTTVPSWGYWVEQGATTLWEDWKGASSRIHVMFGDINNWMYRSLAGIQVDPARPGFRHIIIRPEPVGDLTWVKAEHESVRGRIASAWKVEEGALQVNVTIPANTTATLMLPAQDPARVREGGKPAREADGVKFLRTQGSRLIYELGSGTYAFTVDRK